MSTEIAIVCIGDIRDLIGKPVKIYFESESGPNKGFEILKDAIL